jgi:CRP-like cAMP-binding protein
MELRPQYLQYGEETSCPARSVVYRTGDPVGEKPVFYVIAGLVKIEYSLRDSTFTLWTPPDGIFGLVELLSESPRLCVAHAMERTIFYQWDMEGFFTAAGVSWELALVATTGLTRELRILNAEFGERLGLREGGGR